VSPTDITAGGANPECYARTDTGPRWGQNRGEQWGQFRVLQPEGTRRIYRLNPDGVGALRTWLDGVWGDALAGFQKAAETAGRLDQDDNSNQEDQ
jgi:hypothetical protein